MLEHPINTLSIDVLSIETTVPHVPIVPLVPGEVCISKIKIGKWFLTALHWKQIKAPFEHETLR
jgi:hypothetical protein